METKICKKCGKELILDYYSKKKSNKDGYNNNCKECEKQRHKEYRKNNKDKIKAYELKNKEQRLKNRRKYKENNKDKIKAYRQTEEYKKKKRETDKKYRENHPEKNFNYHQKRRLQEETQGSGITKEQWLECMKFFDFKCAYSGESLTQDNRSLDHIVSLNKNGDNEIWNLVPMKVNYNSSKQDREMLSWYKEQEYYSEERLDKIIEWYVYAFNKYYLGA